MIARALGLLTALGLTTTLVTGAAVLIASDFVDVTMAKAVLVPTAPPPAAPGDELLERLQRVQNLTFFEEEKVPGTALTVMTSTAYASVEALLAGQAVRQWCYVNRGEPGTAIASRVDLAKRSADAPAVFATAGQVPANLARLFGLSAEELVALGPRYCRFDKMPAVRAAE